MKRTIRAVTTLAAVAAFASASHAQPSSGAYVNDRTNSYVQDQVLQSISTVNMIMCIMSSMRAEEKVNAGAYLALIDNNKCDDKGGDGETTNAGASAAVDYIKAIVRSTRSGSDPMSVNAWMSVSKDNGGMTVYADTTVTEGASTSNPNGAFNLRYAGYSTLAPTTPMMQGRLSSSGSTIEFYESGSHMNFTFSTALSLTQSGTTSGSGRIYDTSDPQAGPVDGSFAYNATHFTRQRTGGTQQCFSRSESEADISVWRYGVYKASGERHDVTNPGFQITYANGGNTYYGYAGYYGVYFPTEAMTAIQTAGNSVTVSRPSESGGAATSYTMTIRGGRLTKMTKGVTTLGDIKGMPLRVWLFGSSGETKIYWNGSVFKKTETVSCGVNGCTSTALSPEVDLTAADLTALNMYSVNGHADALGGGFNIVVPTGGASFSDSTSVSYRTRSTVPAATAANLTLVCISECPGTTTNIGAGTSHLAVGGQTFNWGPVLTGNAKTYVFDADGMMYLGSTGASNKVDASTLSANQLTGNNQWGVRSGMMVVASNSVKCDSNGQPSGTTHYCPHLINNADETYQWETGRQPWNWTINLVNQSTSQAATFDPPGKLVLTLSTSNSTLVTGDPKLGSKLMLDFNGFGQLYGIPGRCYNPATNEKGPCGSGNYTNYAPDFSLKAGATVTDAANVTYYVKPLDQEIRFGRKTLSDCAGLNAALTAASTATLPNSTGTNARDSIGATAPTPAVDAPAVIHGVVQ